MIDSQMDKLVRDTNRKETFTREQATLYLCVMYFAPSCINIFIERKKKREKKRGKETERDRKTQISKVALI